MLMLRRNLERGHFNMGWLDTRHSFSFGDYYDPKYLGFSSLRVINEDRVAPGKGFPAHAHRDMEIVTYVLSGALEHRDSLGTGSVIRAGDVQRMSAGTGIQHSEFNASRDEIVHFFQIWIVPERKGLPASYEQIAIPPEHRQDRLSLIGSRKELPDAVTIHQDIELYAGILSAGTSAQHHFGSDRAGWVQLASGSMEVNGVRMDAGDGVAITKEPAIKMTATAQCHALLFDLQAP